MTRPQRGKPQLTCLHEPACLHKAEGNSPKWVINHKVDIGLYAMCDINRCDNLMQDKIFKNM